MSEVETKPAIEVKLYSSEEKAIWDDFVKTAKNSHFFFQRDYMDYHSDRFKDHSLMLYDENEKLIAILPANITDEQELVSHQGLTFGGLLIGAKMTQLKVIEAFQAITLFLKEECIKSFYYKALPYTYHKQPAQEDLLALTKLNANLVKREVTSTIDLTDKIKFQDRRKRAVKKAQKEGLEMLQSNDYELYWQLLTNNLEEKFSIKPVHSLEEITKLKNSFPDNIKLFTAQKNSELLAGTVVYENEAIVHTQYLLNTDAGRDIGALDFLIASLIEHYAVKKKYFDFGVSTENSELGINQGLIEQKEGFGARSVCHDRYEIKL